MNSFLVIDVEATCCIDNSLPKSEQEVIEIGAVLMEETGINEFFESRRFSYFVRPTIHPTLTEFCISLTGIQQRDVDCAYTFPFVWQYFLFHIMSRDQVCPIFCSWGQFDWYLLRSECLRIGNLDHHFPFNEFIDLSARFKQVTGKRRGHRKAMKHFGIEPEGKHHRGFDDAKNIAKMLPKLLYL